MTWHDQVKCEDFLRDTNKHFQEMKTVNFDIIHRQCREEEASKHLLNLRFKTIPNC